MNISKYNMIYDYASENGPKNAIPPFLRERKFQKRKTKLFVELNIEISSIHVTRKTDNFPQSSRMRVAQR